MKATTAATGAGILIAVCAFGYFLKICMDALPARP